MSGATCERPGLARLLDQPRPADVGVTRLTRSARDLLDIAETLKQSDAGLRSLAEPRADTTSPAGRMVLTVCAGMAEFERALIHRRTFSGRTTAMERTSASAGRPSSRLTRSPSDGAWWARAPRCDPPPSS